MKKYFAIFESKPQLEPSPQLSDIQSNYESLHLISPASMAQHLYSLWFLNLSDLKTIVGPSTTSSTVIALFAHRFHLPPSSPISIAGRVPLAVFWCWINLLPFAISNQCQPGAIREDLLNKPWRPLPSKRLSPSQARVWMSTLYPLAVCVSAFLGGLKQSLALICFGHCYNDRGGANVNFLVRNIINAAGFISFAFGATDVLLGSFVPLAMSLARWFATIGFVVVTTVQVQDMTDQAGDDVRERHILPLTIGNGVARWVIACAVLTWSWLCPWLWAAENLGYIGPIALGGSIAVRTLAFRSVNSDKTTFRLWNAWMVSLYILPLF